GNQLDSVMTVCAGPGTNPPCTMAPPTVQIDGVTVRNAYFDDFGLSAQHGSRVSIADSTISDNPTVGVYAVDVDLTVDHNTIANNDGHGIYAITFYDSAPRTLIVTNSFIDGNSGSGIHVGLITAGSSVTVLNTTSSNNHDAGISTFADNATIANSTVAGNNPAGTSPQ